MQREQRAQVNPKIPLQTFQCPPSETELRKGGIHNELESHVRQRTAEVTAASAALREEITECRPSPEQLTRMVEQAQRAAVLEERNRLAREIHDTLAQGLTGVVVHLQAAVDVDTTDPADRQAHIKQALLLAKDSLAEARHSVWALRPHALEKSDLYGALRTLLGQMTAGTDLCARCRVAGTPYPLSPEVETHLLRIGQEALTNTLKHARASELCLDVAFESAQVRLRVQDNGQGFAPDRQASQGFGLRGIRERADSLGAEITITSQPGQGTELVITVPVSPPAEREPAMPQERSLPCLRTHPALPSAS
ncbi:MAG: sensor histidine kinase [Armatimonadetes bacterium]|nr:sensor histidine kinase [Armatimonadota bacterium]